MEFQDWICEEVIPSIRKTGGYLIAKPDILEHDEQRPIVDIIHTLNDSTGLRRDSRIISEPGLYSLILRSRKPEAKQRSALILLKRMSKPPFLDRFGGLCAIKRLSRPRADSGVSGVLQ